MYCTEFWALIADYYVDDSLKTPIRLKLPLIQVCRLRTRARKFQLGGRIRAVRLDRLDGRERDLLFPELEWELLLRCEEPRLRDCSEADDLAWFETGRAG